MGYLHTQYSESLYCFCFWCSLVWGMSRQYKHVHNKHLSLFLSLFLSLCINAYTCVCIYINKSARVYKCCRRVYNQTLLLFVSPFLAIFTPSNTNLLFEFQSFVQISNIKLFFFISIFSNWKKKKSKKLLRLKNSALIRYNIL